eukprot:2592750-Alexandrium_andersonii.AAC.1
MSASLVGSEMCIRDSVAVCIRPASRRARGPPSPLPLAHPTGTSPWGATCCLLYTSDAADDM